MKMFIPLLCFLSFTIAEPPIGDSYASARSHDSFQRSLSYRPPQISSRNTLTEYGPPKISKLTPTYGPPISRVSEEYGVPKTSITHYDAPDISQEYGVPKTRNPSPEYGIPRKYTPSARTLPSEKYGVPSRKVTNEYASARSNVGYSSPVSRLSQEYGTPDERQSLSQYGTPSVRQSSSLSRNVPSSLYGSPKISDQYGAPEHFAKPSNIYLPQKSSFNTKSSFNSKAVSKPSDVYGTPNSLSYEIPSPSSDYSQGFNDFGANTYGQKISQEYGAPRKADLKTNAIASSYSSARSAPSSTYGVPSTRALSSEYGVPEQYNARSAQGYDYARAGDEDIQEPANYDFTYKVNDYVTGSDFGHTESRQENRAEGMYFVVLPDGNKQVVEYEADERGFKPRISVEPVSSGYDDNAADRTSDAPY